MTTEPNAILADAVGAGQAASLPPGVTNLDEIRAVPEADATPLPDVLRIDQAQLHEHLDWIVRDSVEQTLNALLDAEADQ
jgi:hypothetical protein